MIIDYNKLSVPAMRALLADHPPRQVVRHFESRGYRVEQIKACNDRMLNPPSSIKPQGLTWVDEEG